MEKFIVMNAEGKYLTSNGGQLSFESDINKACLHDDDNLELEDGCLLVKVQVYITVVPVVEDLVIVEHTTTRDKVIRGAIRRDLSLPQAKAIDPYTFPKDGGFFIREKYLNKE